MGVRVGRRHRALHGHTNLLYEGIGPRQSPTAIERTSDAPQQIISFCQGHLG